MKDPLEQVINESKPGEVTKSPPLLMVKNERGRYRPASDRDVLLRSSKILGDRLRRGETYSDPDTLRAYFLGRLRPYEREIFCVLFLDNQHRAIKCEDMFFGTIDGASVHPREVLKAALLCNAAAVVFAHNHPSGIAEPSQADKRITERLATALTLVDVRVLDHMVVGDTEVVSFAERGLL